MKKYLLLAGCLFSGLSVLIAQQKNITLSGKITDAKTAQPLSGASIVIDDSKVGTSTDALGTFVLHNIPRGHHLIEISSMGYSTVVEHLDITNDREINIALTTTIIENQGVTVIGISSTRKAPIPITTVRRTQLLAAASANIVDALSRQTGVSQVSTGPAISKPVIRGLSSNRVVVINDGVRQEGQQWGEEHGLELDEASVNRAEILKGPASIMYGSDALAGVINIITNVPVSEGIIKGNVLENYQTNNRSNAAHAEIAGNQKGFNWNIYGTLKSAGDYQNKYDGRVLNSRFSEKNYGGYAGLNKGWGYSHIIFSSFNQKPGIVEGGRDEQTGKFLIYEETPVERIATDEDLKMRDPVTPFQKIAHYKIASDNSFNMGRNRLLLNIAFQNNKRREFANPEDAEEAELYFDLNTITYNAHWVLPEWHNWYATVGFNGLYQQNENRGKEAIIPDYHFNDAGAFVYVRGQFSKYTLSGGLRFDNRSINSKEEKENATLKFRSFRKSFSNVTGSAGISYEANDKLTLKANVGTGFRAPNLAELSSNGAHEGTKRWEYGSQSLKSEKSIQADGEADLNHEHFTLDVNVFYNYLNHFIFYRKLSGVAGGDSILTDNNQEVLTAYQFDQNNARLYGFELSFDLHPHPLDWLHFENKWSFVRGRFVNNIFGTDNLPLIPSPRWLSELRADFKKAGKNLGNCYFLVEADNNLKQDKPFYAYNTETSTPAYTLINAGMGTDVVVKNKTLFSIYLAANNLTDKAYQNHLSRLKYTGVNNVTGRQGVFNMGRNFSVKINIPFSFTAK
jgi:iron complex outermembrane receptor protein